MIMIEDDFKQCPDCDWMPRGWPNDCERCEGDGLIKR